MTAAYTQLREDGAYIEAGENDNLIVQKLAANPTALGAGMLAATEKVTEILRAKATPVDGRQGIAQRAQMRHRRLVADETARTVAQHGLFFGEDEGHGESDLTFEADMSKFVIPGWPEGPGPESITTIVSMDSGLSLR